MDDEEDNVRVLARMLHWAGYDRLELTSDPFEGLRLFESHAPDLVLLDLHMAGLDGFEVMARLRPRVQSGDTHGLRLRRTHHERWDPAEARSSAH